MTTSVIRAGGTGVPGVQTTGGDDGALALKVGPLDTTVEALSIASSGAVTFNDAGADVDFRVESSGSANMLFIDGGNNKVGIGSNSPSGLLQVGPVNSPETFSVVAASGGASTIMRSTTGTLSSLGSSNNVPVAFLSNDDEKMRITTAGLVGIGLSAPLTRLHVSGETTSSGILVTNSTSSQNIGVIANHATWQATGSSDDFVVSGYGARNLILGTNAAERMRIDSSGNVGIGKTPVAKLDVNGTITSSGTHTVGTNSSGNSATLQQNAGFNFKLNGDTASQLGQISWTNNSAAITGNMWGTGDSSSGTVLRVKSLGVVSLVPGNIGIDATAGYNFTTAAFTPPSDNGDTNGTASLRWSVVYAGTGAINTSDEREKQQIADLDAAELRVALAIKGMVKKFKFNDAVTAKGDNARIHVGVIAQDVRGAFIAEGLDPTQYALFCYDAWPEIAEETDDEGTVITQAREAGDRFGIRYDELLAFIIAAV